MHIYSESNSAWYMEVLNKYQLLPANDFPWHPESVDAPFIP